MATVMVRSKKDAQSLAAMELREAGITFVQHGGRVPAQWPCKVLLLDFKRLLSSPEEYKKLQTITNVCYLRD